MDIKVPKGNYLNRTKQNCQATLSHGIDRSSKLKETRTLFKHTHALKTPTITNSKDFEKPGLVERTPMAKGLELDDL